MKSIKQLTEERQKLYAENRALLDAADKEGRSLNANERDEYEKRDAEFDRLSAEIKAQTEDGERRAKLAKVEAELSQPLPRQTQPSQPVTTTSRQGPAMLNVDFGRAGKVTLSPDHPLYKRATPEYGSAFTRYLAGDKADYEQLGLQVANDPKGGYLVPMEFNNTLIKFLDDDVTMRRLGTVLPPTSAKSVGLLSFDTDYASADWTAEVPASDLSEDDAARFGNREMVPHMLTKLVKASRKLVRSSSIGIDAFVARRAAYKFAITENNAFLSGSGAQQPLGAFTASADGVTTARDTTSSSSTSFTMDDLWNLKFSLKYPYQRKAQWVVSRTFMKTVRKLKYGTGEYMLGINGGADMLLDCPVNVDENCPATFTTGNYVAMLADWSFYWIQDGINLEVQALGELFALKNQVGWLFRKETDAMPVLAEAFARLKIGS